MLKLGKSPSSAILIFYQCWLLENNAAHEKNGRLKNTGPV